MGASTAGRVKRGETKYRYIKEFAKSAGITRSGAFKALERQDVEAWGEYVAFLETRREQNTEKVKQLQARASNAVQIEI